MYLSSHAWKLCMPSEDQLFCSFQIWIMDTCFLYGNPENPKHTSDNKFAVGIIISPYHTACAFVIVNKKINILFKKVQVH